jgi:type II secretory pathway component GspD/PulD (secretin)
LDFPFVEAHGKVRFRTKRPHRGLDLARRPCEVSRRECMISENGRLDRRLRAMHGLVAGVWLCALGPQVLAAEPKWPSGTYEYITIDQAVGDALREFGRNIGIPVRVSDRVRGRLNAGMPIGTAKEFLKWVCDRYGLVWYYDGSILHIATEGEVHTETFKLAVEDKSDLRKSLDTLGISDPRYPIQVSDTENVVSVSGPPAYVDAIKRTLGVLTGPPTAHIAREVDAPAEEVVPVRVFRGRRATAEAVPANKEQGGEGQ